MVKAKALAQVLAKVLVKALAVAEVKAEVKAERVLFWKGIQNLNIVFPSYLPYQKIYP